MARFTDFLAGCVVGGALIATGMIASKWGQSAQELQIVPTKDGTGSMVWSVDRQTGQARFVSFGTVDPDVWRAAVRQQAQLAGEALASGALQNTAKDFFEGLSQGAQRAGRKPTP